MDFLGERCRKIRQNGIWNPLSHPFGSLAWICMIAIGESYELVLAAGGG